jgi:hypothetical protein
VFENTPGAATRLNNGARVCKAPQAFTRSLSGDAPRISGADRVASGRNAGYWLALPLQRPRNNFPPGTFPLVASRPAM